VTTRMTEIQPTIAPESESVGPTITKTAKQPVREGAFKPYGCEKTAHYVFRALKGLLPDAGSLARLEQRGHIIRNRSIVQPSQNAFETSQWCLADPLQ